MRGHKELVPVEQVLAAQHGDRDALQRLVADHITMLYNVAGRALGRHTDVDDVVQETLLRVVENIASVRDPARFSGWILTIMQRQIAERLRRRRTARARTSPLDTAALVADPSADFADETILRLGLSGQRRQIMRASRWLDPDDRSLLSLWWLEVAGTITRADLAGALAIAPGHAAVRIKRLREQLEVSRRIVDALEADPRCTQLAHLIEDRNCEPSPVWRKRLARHLRTCPACQARARWLAPPETLLAGLAMVPLSASPAGYATHAGIVVAAAPAIGGGAHASAGRLGATVLSGATVAATEGRRLTAPPLRRGP